MHDALPPSTRTDLLVARLTGATIDDRGDHLVVRTPASPLFHWGNYVQVTTGDPDDADHWIGLFEREFPQATWRAIGLPRASTAPGWGSYGLVDDPAEALTATTPPALSALADGYTAGPLRAEDWPRRLAHDIADNARTGEHPVEEYARFAADQITAWRRLVDAGHAAWFGAWAPGGELAASLGIVVGEGVARYQSVLTGAPHRRRGLARHLLGLAARWAADAGARELVIVADAGSDAARLYRAAGFTPGPIGHGMYRPR